MDVKEKLFLNELDELVIFIDSSGKFSGEVFGNREKLYLPIKKFKNKKPSEVLPKSLGEEVEKIIKKAKKGEKSVIEYSLVQRGRKREYSAKIIPFFDEKKYIGSWVLIKEQTSEKESKEKFENFLKNAIDLIQSVNPKGEIVYVNPAWCKALGYSKKEAIGMNVSKIIRKDCLNHCMTVFGRLARGSDALGISTVFVGKRGQEVYVEGNIHPRFEGKKFIETQGIFRDVTHSKILEEKYRKMFETSMDAIMTLEPPSWKFTSGNKRAVELFGCKSAEEFTRLGPWDLSPEKQPDGRPSSVAAKEAIKKAMETGSNFFEWRHKTVSGKEFDANVLLTKFEYSGKAVLQATVRDITEEKEAKRDLEKFREFAVDRELKMIELKKEVNSLLQRLKEKKKYIER